MTKILVVDDDPDFVEIMRMVLRAEGYEVESAADGDGALRALQARPPDLVVLDVMMATVLDGLDLARRMDEDPALRHIPIIMVSSVTDSAMADMFPTDEYIPIDAWLSKPVRPQDLLHKVAQLVPANTPRSG
ncbi:MAG: response regulator [Chloroflexi bacterium]|nr:response regulator [Chloroflexota bacterium]